ncbi:SCO family protein [Endozoicomonas sp. SM1973]|uniref:SCO family protein n=1 Tax=Spartinivicinus marinus TaxID=2994442 RepID=A0A853I834_9GAMM|nr:SCO family protein [Spartinivicinus marinus]MCX4028080.1 SCO family protein [Spartinivicinus marinus]NYZ66244.1 SCO family protein [Spartinivicinus marinus]
MKYKSYAILFSSLVLIMLSGCSPTEPATTSNNSLAPGKPAPNFTLQSNQGPISLADFKGKGVVLFFGYTNCPDVCPTGLSSLTQALKQLPKTTQQRLQPIFITLDPTVDTPARLAEYLRYFHSNLIGLSSNQQTLEQITQAYHVVYKRQPQPNSEFDFIQHTAYFYFISPTGKLSQYLPHQSSIENLKQALTMLVKTKQKELI